MGSVADPADVAAPPSRMTPYALRCLVAGLEPEIRAAAVYGRCMAIYRAAGWR